MYNNLYNNLFTAVRVYVIIRSLRNIRIILTGVTPLSRPWHCLRAKIDEDYQTDFMTFSKCARVGVSEYINVSICVCVCVCVYSQVPPSLWFYNRISLGSYFRES